MIELWHTASDWFVGFADSDWSTLVLVVGSFFESIIFPLPPDPLLIAIGLIRPESALWLAGLVTVSSVIGAVVGHWLGRRYGRPLLYRFVATDKVERVEEMFRKYGAWAVLVAAFTPIPYKVFAVTAGILDMDRRIFVIVSLIGRGARFFTLGVLLFFYGDSIESFLDTRFETAVVVVAAAVTFVAGLAVFFVRLRRAKDALG